MRWRRRGRSEWQRLVAGWPRSGLTHEAYCTRHGISVESLQRWRRLFDAEAATPRAEGCAASESVPVTLVGDPPKAAGADLTLVLADGGPPQNTLRPCCRPMAIRYAIDEPKSYSAPRHSEWDPPTC